MKMILNHIMAGLFMLFISPAGWSQSARQMSGGQKPNTAFGAAGSYYMTAPKDTAAYYFTTENFGAGARADGKTDVTQTLQEAINKLKREKNFGIVFIPEGTYLISGTIYIPAAIRLIGYGSHRPVIRLKNNAPGFERPIMSDKGKAAYMFWFTSGISSKEHISDAGAGTFYSGMSNINLEIGKGNHNAVALRTHFAQHSFVEHVDMAIGEGKAGIFDVGNEIQDVRFYGGDYGIFTTKASPGWPYMMLDTYFEGQRKAAIKTQEAGLIIVRLQAKNVPIVIDVDQGFWEKLYMEDCALENVSDTAIQIGWAGTPETQVNLRGIRMKNVPVLLTAKDQALLPVMAASPIYLVKSYTAGLVMDSLSAIASEKQINKKDVDIDMVPLSSFNTNLPTDIAPLPAVKTWVNVKTLGAKGDGKQDETALLQAAIDSFGVLYFPEGRYRISKTLQLKPGTVLIGLHPFATQILLEDNTADFSGFGGPVPMVLSSRGGHNIITGIGLNTAKRNTRAVALQWEAAAGSLVNDIKVIGGHGTMRSPLYAETGNIYGRGEEVLWDHQYWSLWVTRNGGGVFKNIWSASTYAAGGVYISDTHTPGRIYAMSIEHHKRNEVRFNNVKNWKVYAMQTEEESRESTQCQPLMIENSANITFANLYMFRVIRVNQPYPYAIRTANARDIRILNLHNYAQTKYTSSHSLYDINKQVYVMPWELAFLHLVNTQTNTQTARIMRNTRKLGDGDLSLEGMEKGTLRLLANGFEMPEGLCRDSKGNVYFCTSGKKRIYKWSAETGLVTLLGDYPWEPLSLACDKADHLLVVFKYVPMEGYLINGKQEQFENPADAGGTSFSGWGNSGFGTLVYSLDPEDPDHSITLCKKVAMGSISPVAQAYYPAHRWRDFHDYKQVVVARPDSCWVAPDGQTIIPVVYDLARSTSLARAVPGQPLYVTDEYNEYSYRLQVDQAGFVSGLTPFAPRGSFSIVPQSDDLVWIADGTLYGYNASGKLVRHIKLPERITGLSVGGRNGKQLVISTYNGLYLLSDL